MSGFTALNVEPEDSFEEEVDETKELQLEEAFKLYNAALRLHSQGPDFYDEAFHAYAELIRSDIFKDPEFVSGYAQDQLDDHDSGDVSLPSSEDATLALLPTNAADPSANSIPQLMFLAYKNRGQFVLEYSRREVLRNSVEKAEVPFFWSGACRKALKDFAEALERDDSDLDLWKKASKVAEVFSSQRIVRFCLESVLAGDDDASGEPIDLSGLDEAFAAGELNNVITLLGDDLSVSQTHEVQPKQLLLKALRTHNDPYPFLSSEAKPAVERKLIEASAESRTGGACHDVKAPTRTWLGIGQALLRTLYAEENGTLNLKPGTALKIHLPGQTDTLSTEPFPRLGSAAAIGGSSMSELPSSIKAADLSGSVSGGAIVESPEKDSVSVADAEMGSGDPESGADGGHTAGYNNTAANEAAVGDQVSALPSGSASMDLPTRKRSSTVAGHDEANETRGKSKRLRARESILEVGQQDEEAVTDYKQYFDDQLEVYKYADQWLFNVTNELLAKAEADTVGSYEDIKASFDQGSMQDTTTEQRMDTEHRSRLTQVTDMRQALNSWSDDMSQALLYGHGNQDLGGNAGLTLFLQHSKASGQNVSETLTYNPDDGLAAFAGEINGDWLNMHETVVLWLGGLLCADSAQSLSSYARHSWSTDLKETVVKIITQEDEQVYKFLHARAHELATSTQSASADETQRKLFEFVQSVFELHLDVYSLITNPSSLVDQEVRHKQRDSLSRWANLTSECLPLYTSVGPDEALTDPLALRYVWASTLYATLADAVDQDHAMLCFRNLEHLMTEVDNPVITLPNNVAMPEISAAAAQREMSRLSTLDFFMSVFDNSQSEPVAIIERLEPILEPENVEIGPVSNAEAGNSDDTTQVQTLISFLASGDISLKLYLWRRLHNAYVAISYTPKTVSCNLRSIETIMSDLDSTRHRMTSDEVRISSMLKWIKDADDLVQKLLGKVLLDQTAFECIDHAHLQSSLSAVAKFSTLVHGFAMYEDSVRVGQTGPVTKSASFNRVFDKCKDRLREIEVRSWTLLYTLFKEATVQFPNEFTNATDNLADYLRSAHNALGVRQYCRLSNKVFLKLVKKELLATQTAEDYSADIFQVLFDLHGLKFDPGVGDMDHGCPLENLDKRTAAQMVEIIMPYVNRRSIKDILKSELKGTIEKIQSALGTIRPASDLSYNKRQISHFLKSQINPKELYRCIKGIGNLSSRPVHSDSAGIAGHGWYFLLGQIALTRFKSVKRINPTPTDDLDIAATFFRHDLEHDNEKWETWYRLAQIYDAKIEEDLVWNVSKINDHRPELATLQRNAIHAYTMAVATALRNADDSIDTAQKIQDMCPDFATRLYASSRQPLTMDAFKTDHNLRHYSGRLDQQMYKALPYEAMRDSAVWNFAAYLLRKKFTTRPKPWTTWYTLGKCLWKLFCSDEVPRYTKKVTAEEVLNAFTWAIEALPARKDSRSDSGYILEPHFKLASIVHKMVHRKAITHKQGVEWLQVTPYARKVNLVEDDSGPDWEGYILGVLKKLGNADKLNWHHRIIARAAHINYDDTQDLSGALGAKHEFTQQIFTKTMTMQVWKPEHERAGRHYVYTSRYVSFFVTLLDKLNDRSNFDQVLRRVRRKPTEFLEHQKLWEEIAAKYVRLLRRQGKVPEGHEKTVFENLSYDEFSKRAGQLEKWAHDPDTTSTMLDVVRDAVEIKKLNNSLMKGPLFDDLIADSYASMYGAFVSQLPPEKPPTPPPAQKEIPATPGYDGANDAPKQPITWDRMRLGNIMGPAQPPERADAYPRPPSILTSNIPMGTTPIGLGLHQPIQSQVSFGSIAGAPVDSLRVPTAVKPGRPKQITKRELIRRAEAAIVKPPPIKTPILSKKPIVLISVTPSRSMNDMVERPDNRLDDFKDEDASVMSSRRGSVHDSADDESSSALSDIDENDERVIRGKAVVEARIAMMREQEDREAAGSSPAEPQDDGAIEMGDGDGDGAEEDQFDGDGDETQDDEGEEAVWHDAEEGPEQTSEKDETEMEIPDSQERAGRA
jgi:hypothetical protein